MKFSRKIHRFIGLVSFVFILSTAITGLLWAYAPHLYWKSGYKEIKLPRPEQSVSKAVISSEIILQKAHATGCENPKSLLLTIRGGEIVWDIRCPNGGGLFSAVSGALLTPLSKDYAEKIAAEYSLSGHPVSESRLVEPWIDRKGASKKSVWKVNYGDQAGTEIVIDANTGEILEESDKVRRFHFFVMKLHQFQFFGTDKTLTAVSGIPLLILLFSGARMLIRKKRKAN